MTGLGIWKHGRLAWSWGQLEWFDPSSDVVFTCIITLAEILDTTNHCPPH